MNQNPDTSKESHLFLSTITRVQLEQQYITEDSQ